MVSRGGARISLSRGSVLLREYFSSSYCCGVVCLCVCWSRPRALQKQMDRTRRRLSCGLARVKGEHTGAAWQIRWIDLCGATAAAMRPIAAITVAIFLVSAEFG